MAIQQPPGGEPFTLAQLTPPAQRRRRKNRTVILVVAVAATVAVLAGSALVTRELWPDAPVVGTNTFNVTGSITLADADGFTDDGTTCTGRSGYDDIHAGAQVTVTDATGTVVALANLEAGRREVGAGCQFLFTVQDVPKGKGFYGVSIGRESRGKVQYSEEDLRTEPLRLVLGG